MKRVTCAARWLVASSVFGLMGMAACIEDDPGPLPSKIVDAGIAETGQGLCADYCTNVLSKCSGLNSVYGDLATCQEACKQTDQGTEGDLNINTVGCRVPFAKAAGSTETCRAAGAYGGDKCGSHCQTFCDLVESNCGTEKLGANAPFGGLKSNCVEACDSMVFLPGVLENQAAADGKNTLNCRMYHLLLSLSDGGREVHCQHLRVPSTVCTALVNLDAGRTDGG